MNNRQQTWLDELELVPSKEKEGWFETRKNIYINNDMERIEAYEQAKIWKCGDVRVWDNAALVSLTLPNECEHVEVDDNAALPYFEHAYTDLADNACYLAGPVGKEKRLVVGRLLDAEVVYRLGCFSDGYDKAIKAIKDKYQDGLADYLPAYLQAIETIKGKLISAKQAINKMTQDNTNYTPLFKEHNKYVLTDEEEWICHVIFDREAYLFRFSETERGYETIVLDLFTGQNLIYYSHKLSNETAII